MLKIKSNIKCKIKDLEDLISLPQEITVNEFDEKSTKIFNEDFQKALNTGQPVIPVYVSSYGGEVYYLLAMIDIILASPVPVATIVSGAAMSCGALLAAFGTIGYRFAHQNSTLMLHDVAGVALGKVNELRTRVDEVERLQNKIYSMLAKHTGKPHDYFSKKLKEISGAEWYMTPYEARDHGLCDFIKAPCFTAEINYNLKFE